MENTSSENKTNNNIIEEINEKLKINIDKYDNINKELSVVQSVENENSISFNTLNSQKISNIKNSQININQSNNSLEPSTSINFEVKYNNIINKLKEVENSLSKDLNEIEKSIENILTNNI